MSDAVPVQDRPVIVGVDDGPDQEELVRFAAWQAAFRTGRLHVAHAIRFPLPGGSATDSREKDAAVQVGARLVERYEDLARSEFPGLTVAGELPVGHAAAVLIERSADADVLVIGHRGSGGFPRLPLGSVSWEVATHADCPVNVIRPGDTSGPPGNRVVVGVDPADGVLKPLDFAYREADLLGAHLAVVYSAEPMAVGPYRPDGNGAFGFRGVGARAAVLPRKGVGRAACAVPVGAGGSAYGTHEAGGDSRGSRPQRCPAGGGISWPIGAEEAASRVGQRRGTAHSRVPCGRRPRARWRLDTP